jgi:hypothetical protein
LLLRWPPSRIQETIKASVLTGHVAKNGQNIVNPTLKELNISTEIFTVLFLICDYLVSSLSEIKPMI